MKELPQWQGVKRIELEGEEFFGQVYRDDDTGQFYGVAWDKGGLTVLLTQCSSSPARVWEALRLALFDGQLGGTF